MTPPLLEVRGVTRHFDVSPPWLNRVLERRGRAIVKAVANYNRPEIVAEASEGLPRAMKGLSMEAIPEDLQLAKRGW